MNNNNLMNLYEEIDLELDVADFTENLAWCFKSEETIFFPEMESNSFFAKFINFGGFVFISMSMQLALYCERTILAAIATNNSRTKKERDHWLFKTIENALFATLTGIAVLSSFFILSCLMLPSIVALSCLDLMIHSKQLWDTRDDLKNAQTIEEKNSILTERNELWAQLLLDALMLVFSILSCLEAPILLTVGTIGCFVTSLIQYGPSVFRYLTEEKKSPSSEIELTKIGMFAEKKKESESQSSHSLAMRY